MIDASSSSFDRSDSDRLTAEVAHVLFLDAVGFSRFGMEEQARLVAELRAAVSATPEFMRASTRGDLIVSDTGDGMALVFFRDPLSPIQCATEIARVFRAHPRLRLRMGIHTGPVSRNTDIAGKANVTGSGINLAQRVMDCGDAGHILLSAANAAIVGEFEAWAGCLRDVGEAEVKHGLRLHVYNLVLGELGNPQAPEKVRAPGESSVDRQTVKVGRTTSVSSAGSHTAMPLPRSGGNRRKIVLLHKRKEIEDERLLALIEGALSEADFEVFIDRHLQIGVAWAAAIEKQITEADAVVLLLSEAAMRSEMIEYEVVTAHRAQQGNEENKPRLHPVRIRYEGPLPDTLHAVLSLLPYSLWTGPGDDAPLVREVVNTLLAPPATTAEPVAPLEPAGGAVPLDSAYYVIRPTDDDFLASIARRDSIVLVKGGRQMGKTSLLARGLQQARQNGARVALTDFQALSSIHLESTDRLYRTLAEMLADQLDLDVLPDEVWNTARGPNMNLERYLRREVLGAIGDGTTLVWGLDEVDRLFTNPFGSEVFGLFRSWHNKRALDPTGPWSRLTLAIAYATEAHLFITDLNQSPFNVGTRLALGDFSEAQTGELNRRYGSPLATGEAVERFHGLLGGQPYLTRRGLDVLCEPNSGTLDAFEGIAARDEGPFGDHLRRVLVTLTQDSLLLESVRALLRGQPCPSPEAFYRLRAAGILRGETTERAQLRCRLYADYLSQHLLGEKPALIPPA